MKFFAAVFLFFPAISTVAGAQSRFALEFEKCKNQFVSSISKSRTLVVKFVKTQKPAGFRRSIKERGKIYYRKNPMALKLELPGERILIAKKRMMRYLSKYREKYISAWDGSNPVFKFLNFPAGIVEQAKSEKNLVTFFLKRGEDRIEICYDKRKKFIESISVSGPVGRTVTRVLEFEKNVRLPKECFKVNGRWKELDLRK
ncbi:MAG: hypothetical protein J7L54_01575 [Elusimicrobia bacterium]|nr:hypothetical protein [Elusimicrobiota bacterium]